jgi:hypothetical protein
MVVSNEGIHGQSLWWSVAIVMQSHLYQVKWSPSIHALLAYLGALLEEYLSNLGITSPSSYMQWCIVHIILLVYWNACQKQPVN